MLERGEKIELLVDKTDRLSTQAFKFEKSVCITENCIHTPLMNFQSRNLKQTMFCKKIKMYLLVFVVLGVSRYVYFCLSYGSYL